VAVSASDAVIPLEKVFSLLPNAVLLWIPRAKKGPEFKDWQKVTRQSMELPAYKAQLKHFTNTGVLLGPPSCNLVTIDFDHDPDVTEFFNLNPSLREHTLTTRGSRGAQNLAADRRRLSKNMYQRKRTRRMARRKLSISDPGNSSHW
jgi:hypothetical protein